MQFYSSDRKKKKIINCYQCVILHILTHGSRCVVSAWVPVSNYISASAHWCHSFPVITHPPACQGQVTSRWAWLLLNWALTPVLPHGDTTISHQLVDSTYQPMAPLSAHRKLWSASDHWCWIIITSESILFWLRLTYQNESDLVHSEQLITEDNLMWKLSFYTHPLLNSTRSYLSII